MSPANHPPSPDRPGPARSPRAAAGRPRRRHAAARARLVTGMASLLGALGITGYLAASHTATSSTAAKSVAVSSKVSTASASGDASSSDDSTSNTSATTATSTSATAATPSTTVVSTASHGS